LRINSPLRSAWGPGNEKVVMIDIIEKLGVLKPCLPVVNSDWGAAVRGQWLHSAFGLW